MTPKQQAHAQHIIEYTERVERIARAICREKCAQHGEPPCWRASPETWPQDCAFSCKAIARENAAKTMPRRPNSLVQEQYEAAWREKQSLR